MSPETLATKNLHCVLQASPAVRTVHSEESRPQGSLVIRGSDKDMAKMIARTMTTLARIVPGTLILLGLAASASAQDSATIGYSVGTVMDQFQAADQAGILAQAKAAGFNMLPPVAASFDVGKQTTDFHTLIGRGDKGVIFVASNSSALAPALEYAKQHNVSTIAVDNTVVKGPVSMIVTGDNTSHGPARLRGDGRASQGQGKSARTPGRSFVWRRRRANGRIRWMHEGEIP
jgi:hypothetical protein